MHSHCHEDGIIFNSILKESQRFWAIAHLCEAFKIIGSRGNPPLSMLRLPTVDRLKKKLKIKKKKKRRIL
jgi:hypothetical protein